MSGTLTVVMIGWCLLLVVTNTLEKKWPVCVYWAGAAILTIGVLWMSARMEIPK